VVMDSHEIMTVGGRWPVSRRCTNHMCLEGMMTRVKCKSGGEYGLPVADNEGGDGWLPGLRGGRRLSGIRIMFCHPPVVGRRLWRGLAQFVDVCASGTRIGEAHNDGERARVEMGTTAVRCQRCGDSRIEVSGACPPSTRFLIPEGPFPRVTLGRHLCPSRSTTARQAATSIAR
jgi:hypothetical protein